ncbi:MAG: CARDB domain-containing protein [Patescibacteria group bacterium]
MNRIFKIKKLLIIFIILIFFSLEGLFAENRIQDFNNNRNNQRFQIRENNVLGNFRNNANKPDLMIDDLFVMSVPEKNNNPNITQDYGVGLRLIFANTGHAPAQNITIEARVDGGNHGRYRENIGNLAPGETKIINCTAPLFRPEHRRNYTLVVVIDPDNQIAELNENNNVWQIPNFSISFRQ